MMAQHKAAAHLILMAMVSGTAAGMGASGGGGAGEVDWPLVDFVMWGVGSGSVGLINPSGASLVYEASDTSGPHYNADYVAGTCGIYDVYNNINGSGLYLGNGWVLTVSHVIVNPAELSHVRFGRNTSGAWVVSDPYTCALSFNRVVSVDSSVAPVTIGNNKFIKVDLSVDNLSDIPVPNMSTQRLPTLGAPGFGNPTAAEIIASATANDAPFLGLQVGWGAGDIGCRSPRYGQIKIRAGVNSQIPYPTGLDTSSNNNDSVIGGENDSGGQMLVLTQNLDYINIGTTESSMGGNTLFSARRNVAFNLVVPGTTTAPADLTGESGSGGDWVASDDPADPLRPDLAVDIHDAVFAWSRIIEGDTRFDLDSNSVVSVADWVEYVAMLDDSEDHFYSPRNYRPLHPDTLDFNEDGRLNFEDIDDLNAVSPATLVPLDFDFNMTGVYDSGDAGILYVVVGEFGHGVLGDLDNDGDADTDDLADLLTHDAASGGAFGGHVAGSTYYKLVLDWDVDGDNDFVDAYRVRNVLIPLDLGDGAGLSRSEMLTGFVFDYDVTYEDVEAAILVGAQVATSTTRLFPLVDNTGSSNPLSMDYGMPDGLVRSSDLVWYLNESLADFPRDDVYPAILDVSGDGRTNFADALWYQNHISSTDPADLAWDIDGDNALTIQDVIAISRLLYLPWDNNSPWCLAVDTRYQTYDQGLVGDFDDPDIYNDPNIVSVPVLFGGRCNISLVGDPDYTQLSSPDADCDDLDALKDAIANSDFAFDGRRFGDPGFRFTMDFDLDGDNDSADQPFVFQRLQPADASGDGVVTPSDYSNWVTAYNTGSLMADANLDGVVTFDDFAAWNAAYQNPCP